jgi:hypothetical protein
MTTSTKKKSRTNGKRAQLAVIAETERKRETRMRQVGTAACNVLEEAAVLYQAVRDLECYATTINETQAMHVREVIARAATAMTEIVVDCGNLRGILRDEATS